MLKRLDPKLDVVFKILFAAPENRELLLLAGCSSIVCVTDLAPGILVQELSDPGMVGVLHELTVWQDDLNNIFIVPIEVTGTGAGQVGALRAWADAILASMLSFSALSFLISACTWTSEAFADSASLEAVSMSAFISVMSASSWFFFWIRMTARSS